MRLLDRYLLRELLIPLGYCLAGFLVFYCSFDLISRLNRFQSAQMGVLEIAEYYFQTTPEILVVVAPVGLLLALLYALTNHCRHNELTAIRAAGISLWRISLPYLAVGLFFAGAVLAINELWAPRAQDRADQILRRSKMKKNGAKTQTDPNCLENLKFRNEPENRSWSVSSFHLLTGQMQRPSIVWELPDGTRREIHAEQGFFNNHRWTFHQVVEWTQLPNEPFPTATKYPILKTDFSESPELIKSEVKVNSLKVEKAVKRPQLSIAEIRRYLQLHPTLQPAQQAVLMTQLQGRLAEPFKCIIVVLIALPFGAQSGRRNVFVGVASSIFICFAFYILQSFFLTLGSSGRLPAVLAAWLPNVLFATTGLWLAAKVR